MLKAQRQRRILELLNERVSVGVATFEKELGVTTMTVWRDLRDLAEQHLLTRTRGGALKREVAAEPSYQEKRTASLAAKRRIATHVARHLIPPRAILSLDGGTTTGELTSLLPDARLTILTNSLPIIHELRQRASRHSIYCSGGLLRDESGTLVGREAVTFFSRRKTDLFLMSATGLSGDSGLTDPNPLEIEVKQAMVFSAKRVVLMLDSTKFGHESLMEVVPLAKIGILVTNKHPPAKLAAALKAAGVEVVVA